jgi:UDP-glucose 4-epimerase
MPQSHPHTRPRAKAAPYAALVTGGAGFIGSHLVEALASEGLKVTVFDNLSSGSEANLAAVRGQINFVKGDIRDLEATRRVAAGADFVFHLAGLASVPLSQEDPHFCLDVNGRGTLNVFSAAQNSARRLVYASTSAVYGDAPAPHAETLLPRPNTPYAALKLLGENLLLFYREQGALSSASLRFFNVYGPRQSTDGPDSGVIPLFIDALARGQAPTIHGDGRQTRDFIHVSDAVTALVEAAFAPRAQGIYNVATGAPIAINALWELLSSFFPASLPPHYAPARPGDPRSSHASVQRALDDLNFAATVPLERGLQGLLPQRAGAVLP